jgi:hypothetical protein
MMYGKPKAAKAKKPAPKKGMAMGGMASSPEALQTQRVATAMPGSAITTNDPKMLAAMQQFQASGQRPVTAPMQTASPVPLPKVKPRRSGSTPVRPSGPKPVNPGKPKFVMPGKPRPQKNMAMGGMTKKGMAKGGMANCGASMKPAQGKGK